MPFLSPATHLSSLVLAIAFLSGVIVGFIGLGLFVWRNPRPGNLCSRCGKMTGRVHPASPPGRDEGVLTQ